MGIFRRETIGRSSLTKEDIVRLTDLQNPYRTDYSYVRSRSYRKDGSVQYENPRMDRFPLNYYKRKWALEEAWNSGFLTYIAYYMMDFCGQMAGNKSNVFKLIYYGFHLFFSGFLPQHRRKFYCLNTSSDQLSNSSSFNTTSLVTSERTTFTRVVYRCFLTVLYIVTLGYFPNNSSSSEDILHRRNFTSDSQEFEKFSDKSSSLLQTSEESQEHDVSNHMERVASLKSERSNCLFMKFRDLCWELIPLLLIFLLTILLGIWFFNSKGSVSISDYRSTDLKELVGKNFQKAKLYCHSFWELLLQLPCHLTPSLLFNYTVFSDYMEKVSSILNIKSGLKNNDGPEKDSQEGADLYRLLSDKEAWKDQLTELRKERELNQEQLEELKKSIDLVQSALSVSMENDSLRSVGGEKLSNDRESFFKMVENVVAEKITEIKGKESEDTVMSVINTLKSQFDRLSEELHNKLNSKLDALKRDIESDWISSANLERNKNVDAFKEGLHLSNDEMIRTELEADLKIFITKEIVQEVENHLSVLLGEKEAAIRHDLLTEIRKIIYGMLKNKIEKNSHVENADSTSTSGLMSTLDYSAIKLMINEALKKYDADKTGKVDYALESSGGSVWSTRCTEAYEKSRLESLFGIPLWYSSYSPRQVIQHRSSLGSGECWAFRGTGYLVIKLAYPVFVTEVSYEHLPSCVHPEHDIKSSPRNFEIWSLKDVDDLSSRFLIGEYEYDNKGEALQTFKAQNIPNYKSPFIELIVHSNWGADYTCLYRLRVHGHRTVNTTIDSDIREGNAATENNEEN